MTNEDLIKILKENQYNKTYLQLTGMINYNLEIDKFEVIETKNAITIKNNLTSITLKLNQLMKIQQIDEKNLILIFDQLQKIAIRID